MDSSSKAMNGSAGGSPVGDDRKMGDHEHEFRISIILLRSFLLVLVIISEALMVTDRETGSVPLPFFGLPRPVFVTKTAKYELVTGLKFYVDALGVVIGYTVLHLLFNIGLVATKGTVVDCKSVAWISFIADSMMGYLLLSGAAVATEIGYLAEEGAPAVLWRKVCNAFGYFCTVYAISVVICFIAALVSFVVVGISAYHLFRLYGIQQQAAREKEKLSAEIYEAPRSFQRVEAMQPLLDEALDPNKELWLLRLPDLDLEELSNTSWRLKLEAADGNMGHLE
ncbi:hypothetical protein SELMODRAFT_446616 [Selaginella moellendorffii]|nr:hypothetical protein SELMODRAFT_446616 [Selaginella moellendorffii]